MPEFRYQLSANWFKGNTHIHSTASDGGKTFSELAQMYSEAGYDFLFRTDHWVASDAGSDGLAYPLVWLDGIELDGPDQDGSNYHVVGLGKFDGLDREMGIVKAMEAIREQGGLLVLAHPQWMGNSFDEALRYSFDGVEVYNHVCRWLNGKGEGISHWNAMLERRPNTLSISSDDAHIKPSDPGWNGGWIMVNAPECTPEAIFAAIRAGNYYSTCGPQIYSMQYDGVRLTVQCSPVQFARLVGAKWQGARTGSFDGSRMTEVTFAVPQDRPYLYFEIEDDQGRRAWTNPLFLG